MKLGFPLKHWLLTLLLGPLFQLLREPEFMSVASSNDDIGLYFTIVVVGIVFSLPSLAIYFLFFRYLLKRVESVLLIKVLLNLITVIMIGVTFYLIEGTRAFSMFISYSIALVVSSCLFRLPSRYKETPKEESIDAMS